MSGADLDGRVSLGDVIAAHGQLREKPAGSGEWHGACRICGEGDDRFWAKQEGATLILKCRRCEAGFEAHLQALGFELGGGESIVPPLMPAGAAPAPPPPPEVKPGAFWRCEGPDGASAVHTFTGRDPETGRKTFSWDPTGIKAKRLVYIGGNRASTQAVVVEGEKAADALAHYIPDLRVVAVVGAMPDAETLSWALTGCAEITIWPDNDVPGMHYRDKLLKAIQEAVPAAGVKVVNVGALHPRPIGDGWDAADWRPVDPANELDKAISRPGEKAEAPVLVSAATWVEAVRQPPDLELTPPSPGLLYKGRAVLLHQKRGGGKSTYAAWAAAAASRVGRRVVLLVDDDARTWADRLLDFGADLERIEVGRMRDVAAAGLDRVVADRDVLIVDSWRRWSTACKVRGANALNDEALVGPVIDALVDVAHGRGLAVLVLANQPKDGDTARGSFSLEDAVDAVRTIKRAGSTVTIETAEKVRHGIPAGPWTLTLGADGFTSGGGGPDGDGGPLVPGTPESRYEDAALKWLMQHGEASTSAVCRGATGNHRQLRQALDRLLAAGRVTHQPDGRGGTIWAPDPALSTLDPGSSDLHQIRHPDPTNGIAVGSGGSAPDPVPDPGGAMGIGRMSGSAPDPVPDPAATREPPSLDDLVPLSECEITGYRAVVGLAKVLEGADAHAQLADIGATYATMTPDAVAAWERTAAQTLQRIRRAGRLEVRAEVAH